jgi:hypothetical protein
MDSLKRNKSTKDDFLYGSSILSDLSLSLQLHPPWWAINWNHSSKGVSVH